MRDCVLSTDHRETVAELRLPVERAPVVSRRTALNYKRADFDGLRRSLALLPWSALLDGVEINEAVDTFYELLSSAIADHVPTVVLRRRLPPWFDATVRAALRVKEAAFRRLRRVGGRAAERDFADRRRELKSVSEAKYFEYLKNLTDDFNTNPKRVWSFYKCLSKKSSISPVLISPNGSQVTCDQARSSLLNDSFAAKFTDPAVTRLPFSPAYHLDNLTHFSVTDAAVLAALKSVSPYKACGPDNVSARIVAECAEELAVPLAILCRASVASGVFPNRWKGANIVPIFKKGDRRDPNNYRSVSLLPLFGKVLERIVFDQLFRHVSPVISAEQHGFMPRRSCMTNLAVYLRSAWDAISEGSQLDAIYTDYSAAFQSVNHTLLTHKLEQSFHVRDLALKWFISYLADRRQRVIVNGKTSHWQPVTSGVPEGSLLAPILFTIFINDLPASITSDCLMYADDVKLYYTTLLYDFIIRRRGYLRHVEPMATAGSRRPGE